MADSVEIRTEVEAPDTVPSGAPLSVDADPSALNAMPSVSEQEQVAHDEEEKIDFSPQEARSIMEVIANTGKFWHDWSFLRQLLSFQLKQVLSQYPEAEADGKIGPQPGETFIDLGRRLNEALLSFEDGPPFTLQRLCEILLSPRSMYKSLSKVCFAVEKVLLVTSTLTKCTDPYPSLIPEPATEIPDKARERPPANSSPAGNGIQSVSGGDVDEEMVDAEAEEPPSNQDTEMPDENDNEASHADSVLNCIPNIPSETDAVPEHV